MADPYTPPTIEDQNPRDRRRQLWALLLLLLLVPSLLCLIAQFALRSTMTHQADTDALSRLFADYGPWTDVEYLPVDRAIIEAARLDRAGLGRDPESGSSLEIAELPETSGPLSDREPTQPPTEPPASVTPEPSATPPPSTITTTPPTPSITSTPPTPSITTTPPPPPGGEPPPDDEPPPPPPPPGGIISGLIFEDLNHQDGAYQSGTDTLLGNVIVRLFTSGGTSVAETTTDSVGAFSFTVSFNDTFVLHVASASIGDANTPPAQGCNGGACTAVAEQTFEHDGTTGNSGDGALGGDDPAVADTNNPAAPGDNTITFSVASANVTGLQMGFSYNVIVNTNPNGQGSLEQFIQNGNAIAGQNTSEFAIPTSGPNADANCTGVACTIQTLAAGLTAVNDSANQATTIDGSTQASGHDIVIDGGAAAANVSGLVLNSENNVVNDVTVQNFDNGGTSTGIEIHANGNQVTNSNLDGNVVVGVANVGQIHILDGADGVTVSGNTITNSNGDGVRVAECTPAPCVGSENVTISNNTITNSGAEGMTIRDANNVIVRGNTITGSLGAAGIQFTNTDNSFIQGNTIQGNTGDGIRLEANVNPPNDGSSGNIIGPDPGTGQRNLISGNGGDGVEVNGADSDQNTITQNDIRNNFGRGININDGTGANADIDAPQNLTASVSGGVLTVDGNGVSAGSTIEVFYAEASDDSPLGGEGPEYLGSTADDGAGGFSYSEPAGSYTSGGTFTATVTDANGNTSEFAINADIP